MTNNLRLPNPCPWPLAAAVRINDVLTDRLKINKGEEAAMGAFHGLSLNYLAQIIETFYNAAKDGKAAPSLPVTQEAMDTGPEKIHEILEASGNIRIGELARRLGIDQEQCKAIINQEGSGLEVHTAGWVRSSLETAET